MLKPGSHLWDKHSTGEISISPNINVSTVKKKGQCFFFLAPTDTCAFPTVLQNWERAYFTGAMLIPQVWTRLEWETRIYSEVPYLLPHFSSSLTHGLAWNLSHSFSFLISSRLFHLFPTILCPHRWYSRSTRDASGLGWSSFGNDCVTETAGSELVPSFIPAQRQIATGAHWTRTTWND